MTDLHVIKAQELRRSKPPTGFSKAKGDKGPELSSSDAWKKASHDVAKARGFLVLRAAMPEGDECPRFRRRVGFPNHTGNDFAGDFDAEVDLENVILPAHI